MKSTLAGVMAADLAPDTPSAELKRYATQPKPSRIPPEPFAWLGINAAIRWQEMRAGRER